MAIRSDLEIAGRHRRNDRTPRSDDPGYRAHDRWCDREPDDRRRDRWGAVGDHRAAVVFQRDILINANVGHGSRRALHSHYDSG